MEPLFHESFYAALPAGHALTSHQALSVSDLLQEKLLLLDEGHCLRDQALDLCGARQDRREEVRATSLETLPTLATDVGPRVSRKAVEIRPFSAPSPGRTIALVWRRRAPFPETFERLAASLKATLPAGVEAV